MCMGCMTNADFMLTGGLLGAASLRVGARQLLQRGPRLSHKVTDQEAQDFMASLVADADQPDRQPASQPVSQPDGPVDRHGSIA